MKEFIWSNKERDYQRKILVYKLNYLKPNTETVQLPGQNVY
jgi:hypothetical protein